VAGRALVVLVALAALAAGGCGDGGDKAAASMPLDAVAPFVHGSSAGVSFVDWSSLKKRSPEQLRRVSDIGPLYSQELRSSRKLVGFGVSDLDWEARVEEGGAPVTVLGFPGGFDLGKVEDALKRCGYRRSAVQGGALYSKPVATSCGGKADTLGTNTPPPTLASVAVLADDHLLVAAASPATVKAAVSQRGGGDFKKRLDDLGPGLDGVVAGYLGYGQFGCRQFAGGGPNLTPEIAAELKRQVGDLGRPYDMLLLGFVPAGGRFDGRIVLDYADADDAKAGLEKRRKAFENVPSPTTRLPLTKLFRLTSAKAEDDAVVFTVAPADGRPLTLFAPLTRRDLLFAGC
jgi:hypothetical protein